LSELEKTYTSIEVQEFFRIDRQRLRKWRKDGFIRGLPTSPASGDKPAAFYVYLESEVTRVFKLLMDQGKSNSTA
jgi:hypothetical protein